MFSSNPFREEIPIMLGFKCQRVSLTSITLDLSLRITHLTSRENEGDPGAYRIESLLEAHGTIGISYTRRMDHVRLRNNLKIAAGFEIRTFGAHELTLLLVELCPAIWAGTFDQFCAGRVRDAGRHVAYRLVVLCRNNPPDAPELWRHRPAGLQML